jgi:hypothetical protein
MYIDYAGDKLEVVDETTGRFIWTSRVLEQMLFGREYHQKYIDSTTVTHKKSGLP